MNEKQRIFRVSLHKVWWGTNQHWTLDLIAGTAGRRVAVVAGLEPSTGSWLRIYRGSGRWSWNQHSRSVV